MPLMIALKSGHISGHAATQALHTFRREGSVTVTVYGLKGPALACLGLIQVSVPLYALPSGTSDDDDDI